MKIGFDAKRLYCNFTGLGNYSRSVVKNLQLLFPDNDYHLYTPKRRIDAETDQFYKSPDFHTYIPKTAFKSFWRSYAIVSLLKKDGIELFHGLSNELPANLKQANIASVVTIHDLIFKVLPETYPFIDRQIYNQKVKKACENADCIIAVSESTKKDIVHFYGINPEKIEVVYPSCNPIYYESAEIEDAASILAKYQIPSEYLLSVGTVEKRKNLKLIIEAYALLAPELRIPLVIIGGGKSYRNEVIALIKEKGLEAHVVWIDKLKDNRHLQAVYQQAKALIYPSRYEGFGLPVVEALLSKTPVITSNISSLPEAGGPSSLLVDPNDASALSSAISQVLTDEDLRNQMIKEGYAYAWETFAPDKLTQQLEELYIRVLRNLA